MQQLKEQLSTEATELEKKEGDIASLQDRLTKEEEERRTTLASVVRLEAQVQGGLLFGRSQIINQSFNCVTSITSVSCRE